MIFEAGAGYPTDLTVRALFVPTNQARPEQP